MRSRTCIASGQTLGEQELVRFVAGPDGQLFVDIRARAPGRGVWVKASASAILDAAARGQFARSLRGRVKVPDDLPAQVEKQLRQHCLTLLGLARRSGALVNGYDKVRAEIRVKKPGWLLEASDGAADGRGKVLALAKACWEHVPVAGCFSSTELGAALGRDQQVHALLLSGGFATRLGLQLQRLSGFTPLIPDHWPEMQACKSGQGR